jgi:hypothetical protein
MKILRTTLLGLVAIGVLAVGAIYVTGNGALLSMGWAYAFGGPSLPFNPDDAVDPPDYADPKNWAALPQRTGVEDVTPAGTSTASKQGEAPVDVFFIHPTGYLGGDNWTFSMDANTITEENTQWMMANQASAYNGCCNVYAPRYRQAHIFAYLKGPEIREEVLGFAFQDVASAFDYFIANYSQGRPFVIASHSQGTHHGVRLLQEKIDGTPVAQRMVAAYLIGGGIGQDQFAEMQDISLCDGPTELRCAVHWDTYSEAAIDTADAAGNVCTNPLTWKLNGGLADQSQHVGAVPISGEFQIVVGGSRPATGMQFEPLEGAIPNMLQAECKAGVLFVTDQSGTGFDAGLGSIGGGNYHLLDYPLFHMDIRENAKRRVATYLGAMPSELP